MINLRLKELIDEKGINPLQLKEIIKISGKSKIYEWLRGDNLPGFKFLIKMVDYFNCSIEFFIGRTDIENTINFKITPAFDVQLKNVMKEKNITQYKMIKDKIVNSSFFNRYFTKKSLPNIETLIKLADYFKISIDELVGRV